MSVDRDHLPINPNGNNTGEALLPTYADQPPITYPDRTHSTLPIVAASEMTPPATSGDIDPNLRDTPWYKTKMAKIVGIVGVPLAVAGGGIAIAQHVGAEKPAVTSIESASGFPLDVVYGSGATFSELPAAEQAAIRQMHALTPEQFAWEPLDTRFQYSKHVIDINTPHIIEYSQKRSPFTGIPALVDYGPARASNSAEEIESQRAIKLAIMSRLIDESTGIPATNYTEILKLAGYMYSPDMPSYQAFVELVKEAERQGDFMENITPCTVLESYRDGDTMTYTCEMQYTEESDSRFTHAVRSAVWLPFTDYDGKPAGSWVLTRNDAYRYQPHL